MNVEELDQGQEEVFEDPTDAKKSKEHDEIARQTAEFLAKGNEIDVLEQNHATAKPMDIGGRRIEKKVSPKDESGQPQLTTKEVLGRVGGSFTLLRTRMERDSFPKPTKCGRSYYWVEHEVAEWLKQNEIKPESPEDKRNRLALKACPHCSGAPVTTLRRSTNSKKTFDWHKASRKGIDAEAFVSCSDCGAAGGLAVGRVRSYEDCIHLEARSLVLWQARATTAPMQE